MSKIDGNLDAIIQKKETLEETDEMGSKILKWLNKTTLKDGFLDYLTGETKVNIYNSKIQESSHIFICDYQDLESLNIISENSRVIIKNKIYSVLYIDNPGELNEHLEIYLKYIGGQ